MSELWENERERETEKEGETTESHVHDDLSPSPYPDLPFSHAVTAAGVGGGGLLGIDKLKS